MGIVQRILPPPAETPITVVLDWKNPVGFFVVVLPGAFVEDSVKTDALVILTAETRDGVGLITKLGVKESVKSLVVKPDWHVVVILVETKTQVCIDEELEIEYVIGNELLKSFLLPKLSSISSVDLKRSRDHVLVILGNKTIDSRRGGRGLMFTTGSWFLLLEISSPLLLSL